MFLLAQSKHFLNTVILNRCVSTNMDYLCGCREKELAAVKINAADVDIIANELEVGFFPSLFLFVI